MMGRKSSRLIATVMLMLLAALSFVIGAARGLPVRVKSASTRLAKVNEEARADFMLRVYEMQARLAREKIGEPFTDLPKAELEVVEGSYRLRKDAAEHCRLLLKQAKSDLTRQKERGVEEALKVSDIGIYSAYRSVEHDRLAWRNAFEKHFRETKSARANLRGGEYGDEAVEMMVRLLRMYKAVPGYSRHTSGAAVDFMTIEENVRLTADTNQNRRWKKAWFYKWLVQNAGRFKFNPLVTEAWHWEYTK